MSMFTIIVIGFLLVKAGKSFLNGLFEESKTTLDIKEPRKYNIKYYSEGRLLPNPFHIEYMMLAETVPSCCAEMWWNIPAPNKYGYTHKHECLAISYLWDQKDYLENLN
jgi:hypothetical protein